LIADAAHGRRWIDPTVRALLYHRRRHYASRKDHHWDALIMCAAAWQPATREPLTALSSMPSCFSTVAVTLSSAHLKFPPGAWTPQLYGHR